MVKLCWPKPETQGNAQVVSYRIERKKPGASAFDKSWVTESDASTLSTSRELTEAGRHEFKVVARATAPNVPDWSVEVASSVVSVTVIEPPSPIDPEERKRRAAAKKTGERSRSQNAPSWPQLTPVGLPGS